MNERDKGRKKGRLDGSKGGRRERNAREREEIRKENERRE